MADMVGAIVDWCVEAFNVFKPIFILYGAYHLGRLLVKTIVGSAKRFVEH